MRFQSVFIAVVILAVSMVIADDTLDEFPTAKKIELLGGKVTRDEKGKEKEKGMNPNKTLFPLRL